MRTLEKHLAAVQTAKLPGILRDKQPAWEARIKAAIEDVHAKYAVLESVFK